MANMIRNHPFWNLPLGYFVNGAMGKLIVLFVNSDNSIARIVDVSYVPPATVRLNDYLLHQTINKGYDFLRHIVALLRPHTAEGYRTLGTYGIPSLHYKTGGA